MSPCSVYPGRLPASLRLASASRHEERLSSFRVEEKPDHSPKGRPGNAAAPASPGGEESLFQTSISRDISNSLITSRESGGACLSMWAPVTGPCEESLRSRH